MDKDEMINKKFVLKAKNGKFVEYVITEYQQFAPSVGFYYAQKTKGKNNAIYQFAPAELLEKIKTGEAAFVV